MMIVADAVEGKPSVDSTAHPFVMCPAYRLFAVIAGSGGVTTRPFEGFVIALPLSG
jgi:hypothetical protein